MFQHTHAGLTFNRNGTSFEDSHIVLKSNDDLLGQWTEIIFNTNWHPDPKKGFMRVWIDGQLKIDFQGISNHPSKGKEQRQEPRRSQGPEQRQEEKKRRR